MSKKRTSLESVLGETTIAVEPESTTIPSPSTAATKAASKRPCVKQQTAYLPLPVYEQVRRLAFEENAKMHDFLMEGLDHVFKNRGLPSIDELTGKNPSHAYTRVDV